jgi:hypothetical protein
MSKGHGKWERAILDVLKQVAAFYLTDLLPVPHTRSQVVALNRAARNLADAGKIEIVRWFARFAPTDEQPRGFLAVFRVGYPAPTRNQITRLKRCIGSRSEPHATLTETRRKRGPVIETDYTVNG